MRLISIFLTCALLVNCTKNAKVPTPKPAPVEKEKIVNYQSPMKFIYSEALNKKDLAFKAGSVEYPLSQLFRTNKSLARLVADNKKIWLISAYREALGMIGKKTSSVQIELPFEKEDLDIDALLQSYQIEVNPSVNISFSKKNSGNDLTKINAKTYTQHELAQNNLDHSRSLLKIFNLAMKRIETRLSRMVISQAAKEKQQTFSEFVEENGSGATGVDETMVREFAKENSIPETDLNEKMTATIKEIVKSKNQNKNFVSLASEILGNTPVSVALYRPYFKVSALERPTGTPVRGHGKVQVSMISNFTCKRCAPIEENLTEIFNNVQDNIQYSYLFRIRPEDRMSKFVAEASLCINDMDATKFWELNQESLKSDFKANEATINSFLESNGLSVEELRTCLASQDFHRLLDRHLELTKPLEALTLPVVIVNDHVLENPQSAAAIEELIAYELKHSKEEPKQTITANKTSWFSWLRSLFS